MITLRFGRLVQFDDRSKNYGIFQTAPPDGGIDLSKREIISKVRTHTFGEPLLNQGKYGACAGMGMTNALRYEPGIKALDSQFALNFYFETQKHDDFDGGEYPGANPVAGGTSILAICKEAKRQGLIKSYHFAFSLEQVLVGIGYFGAAITGLTWTEGMADPDPEENGISWANGEDIGGHCVAATFVDKRLRLIGGPNSWSGWNKKRNGGWMMTWAAFEERLHAHGEAVFVVKA